VTGQCGETPEYFRLHINQFNTIQTVTCLSKSVSKQSVIAVSNNNNYYYNN